MSETTNPETTIRESSRVKRWVIIILCVLVVLAGLVLWVRSIIIENQQAEDVVNVYQQVQDELTRCRGLLAKNEGAFNEYEYCQQFVNRFTLLDDVR